MHPASDWPAGPASRRRAPLALTVGLHLLLVLAWFGARDRPARETPARASRLVFVQVPPLPAPRSLPKPDPAMRPAPARARVQPAHAIPAVPDQPVQAAPDTVSPAAFDPTDATPAAPSGPGDLLASSKAMAGRVDRELRKGALAPLVEPERKWERFAEAFAAARKDTGRVVRLDSYTAPDGVIIYRKTVGDRVACYRSGSVGGLVTGFGAADGQSAGRTTCPSGVSWTRH